jgi:copper chaperone CopZ
MGKSVGCTACLTSVYRVLDASPYVIEYKANFDESIIQISYDQQEGKEYIIIQELCDAGYPMTKVC